MGGGNAQKSATSRARNAEKMAKIKKGGTSQLKQNSAAQSHICNICRTAFICTMSREGLEQHVKGRHEKSTFEACFPDYDKK